MWSDGAGGWTYEWSKLAKEFADQGDARTAANCYGAAKFPTISTQARQDALVNQVEQYIKASKDFPVKFDRKLVPCYHGFQLVEAPVHIISHPEADSNSPVMIASGGVDTWKMDLHMMWEKFALACKCHVVAFDLPGNGELSHVPMDDKGDEVIRGIIKFGRGWGNGTVCHFGFSMGGHYSAISGLRHDVDLAIVCGGPTNTSFTPENAVRLTAGYGMDGIMCNAIGRWQEQPPTQALIDSVPMFNLKYLVEDDRNCPMYVINGESDVHIDNNDVKAFEGRKDTEMHLFPGTGHCCDANPKAVGLMIAWLKGKFNPE
jgi:esterase FrsA